MIAVSKPNNNPPNAATALTRIINFLLITSLLFSVERDSRVVIFVAEFFILKLFGKDFFYLLDIIIIVLTTFIFYLRHYYKRFFISFVLQLIRTRSSRNDECFRIMKY